MSDCVCELSGFCTVRQLRMRITHQMLCQKSRVRVDQLLHDIEITTSATAKAASTLGELLLTAIEAAVGVNISCSEFLQYLTTLDIQQTADCDEIVASLVRVIPPQSRMQEKYTTQQKLQDWLSPIVTAVLLEWVDSDEANVTPQSNI